MSNIGREPSGAPEPWLKLEHVPDPPPLDRGPLAALHWKQEAERLAADLRGAVGLLRESRRYVAGHAFTQPVGDPVAAALLARIDAALGEGQ